MRQRLFRIAYWLAVLAVSLALVAALIYFLESRDSSTFSSRANTTIRFSAL